MRQPLQNGAWLLAPAWLLARSVGKPCLTDRPPPSRALGGRRSRRRRGCGQADSRATGPPHVARVLILRPSRSSFLPRGLSSRLLPRSGRHPAWSRPLEPPLHFPNRCLSGRVAPCILGQPRSQSKVLPRCYSDRRSRMSAAKRPIHARARARPPDRNAEPSVLPSASRLPLSNARKSSVPPPHPCRCWPPLGLRRCPCLPMLAPARRRCIPMPARPPHAPQPPSPPRRPLLRNNSLLLVAAPHRCLLWPVRVLPPPKCRLARAAVRRQ